MNDGNYFRKIKKHFTLKQTAPKEPTNILGTIYLDHSLFLWVAISLSFCAYVINYSIVISAFLNW